ncbi:MAG TPA: polyamine aminopropyltransferase [Gammaproteobacteria bacterium]|nr:polyamine aminopropyltransferase [Gammaproteobacteria bacterium]
MTLDSNWFSEAFNDGGSAFSMKLGPGKKLREVQSPYQKIEIYDTETFGKLMVIDGCIMLTTRDNFIYHEMMSHPVMFTHPNPKRVLIIGGGDCGTLREVLKHPQVQTATQVDIDEQVTRMSEQFFPELCESNNDKRAELRFDDGIEWVRNAADGYYDIIIVDSTDPVGPGEVLFTKEFFNNCKRILGAGGLFVQQSESPLYHSHSIIKSMQQNLRGAGFADTQTLLFPQCVYPSGWWSCTMACKDGKIPAPRNQKSFATQYYNYEVHQASKVLPEFMKNALA